MTNDVKRYNLKTCPACKGTGKATIFKEYTWEPIVCLTCLGEGYLPAPEPEEEPIMIERLQDARFEIARLETDLASAQAEIATLKAQLADKQAKFDHFREAVIFAEEQLQGASAEAHERGLIDLEEAAYNSYLKVHWLATRGEE